MSGERRILVLYGSQTGTAQDVAERIERDAVRRHLLANVKSLDQYDIVCVASMLSVCHIVLVDLAPILFAVSSLQMVLFGD